MPGKDLNGAVLGIQVPCSAPASHQVLISRTALFSVLTLHLTSMKTHTCMPDYQKKFYRKKTLKYSVSVKDLQGFYRYLP
jgi:hypothetical protein